MIRYRQTLLVLLFTMMAGVAVAQNNTNSPYTRYGYGQLADQGSGNSKAMGGVAYGLRDKYQVNFANPASYTAVDSLTFIFDGGVSLQNTNLSDGKLKRNAKNSSVDYVTMMFRLHPKCAMSLGLLPYSNVGYNMNETQENEEVTTSSSNVNYYGEGGLHQLYIGLGYKVWSNFSIGANVSYLWGDMTHGVAQTFPNSSSIMPWSKTTNLDITSYKLDFGAQYTHRFDKKHALTVGVVFSPGHDVSNEAYTAVTLGNSTTGYTSSQKDTVVTCGIPTTFGVGATYTYNERLTVGMDVMFQNWSSTAFMSNKEAFTNRTRVSVGAEYLPNPQGRSYLSHVKYRVGAFYNKPYYKIDGVDAAKEYGVSMGFGLPVLRSRSVLSLSAQYVRTEGAKSNFLTENTFRICVGVTFNERWFFKRTVD
ncbi:MAG: hypothetical protein IJ511_02020 [Bacteroides sp.]|nr:hypothetical protein [Bacteroides sp.]